MTRSVQRAKLGSKVHEGGQEIQKQEVSMPRWTDELGCIYELPGNGECIKRRCGYAAVVVQKRNGLSRQVTLLVFNRQQSEPIRWQVCLFIP